MIEWRDEYSTGMKVIDEHHKVLFKYFNELEGIVISGQRDDVQILLILDALESFTHFHFGFEEICMAERKCSASDQNKCAHRIFIKTIFAYKERIKNEGVTEELVDDMYTTMLHWLLNHIITIDRSFLGCPNPPEIPAILKNGL